MWKKPIVWILVGGLVIVLTVVVLVYAPPRNRYTPVPVLSFVNESDFQLRKYKSGTERVFYVEEATYIIPDADFDDEVELEEYIDNQIQTQGWIDNSQIVDPVIEYCELVKVEFSTDASKVYVSADFVAVHAVNRWAATHLCLYANHDIEEHYFEIVVATLDPTTINIFID